MPAPNLLSLPLEIRLEIYTYLLTLTPLPIYADSLPLSKPLIHPSILLVNRQINAEATPALYRDNTFTLYQDISEVASSYTIPIHSRDDSLKLTSRHGTTSATCRLRLRDSMKTSFPLSIARERGVRRFILHLKSDSPIAAAAFNDKVKSEMMGALTGAESLTLQVVVGGYLEGVSTRHIEALEEVRGVRFVDVRGPVVREKMKRYLAWLRVAMMGEVGGEVRPFVQDIA